MNNCTYTATRQSLIQRLKNWEDQESWQRFLDIYGKLILGYALKCGLTDAEAQEVLQETTINVAMKIKDFKVGSKHGSFKAWLIHTARWRVRDQFRKRAREIQAGELLGDATTGTAMIHKVPDPVSLHTDAGWEEEWEQSLFDAALEKVKSHLDSDLFQAFYLHVVKQWPVVKVADATGAKAARVYFAKYKVSRMIKGEIARLKKQLL